MSDPISPTGSPGQVPLTLGGGLPSLPTSTSKPAGSAASTAVADGTGGSVSGLQARLDSAKLNATRNKAQTKGSTSPQSLDEATETLKEYIKNLPSDLQFRKDESSGYTIFKVINPITHEVIREYPPKEVVEMARRLKELDQGKSAGVLIDQQS